MSRSLSAFMLVGLVLLFVVVGTAGAASRESVLYAFHGKDGWNGGSVIADSAGNLYGTTADGGKYICPGSGGIGCGVVFRLARGANGKWRETVLHAFDDTDGFIPAGTLVLEKKGSLYGTTVYGGPACSQLGCGVVFELVRGRGDKWTFKVLHNFALTDGANPYAGLTIDSQGSLYGTTSLGGDTSCNAPEGCGVVFKLTEANGIWTETVVYSFEGKDGALPYAPLTLDAAGNLYGTTEWGGAYDAGTVFTLNPGKQGQWSEGVLHSFSSDTKDGGQPVYGVVFDAKGNLYGTTQFGGTRGEQGWGTAFKLTPDENGKWTEAILHRFDEHKVGGGFVSSGLVPDSQGNLYGSTYEGGKYTCPTNAPGACGVVFRLAPDADGKWAETVLHSFGKGKDGAIPGGGLARDSAGHLFGVTADGGYLGGACGQGFYTGCGVVFEITP